MRLLLMILQDRLPYLVQDSRPGAKNLWIFNTEGHPLKVHSGIG